MNAHTFLIDPVNFLTEWLLNNWTFEESDEPDRWFTSRDKLKLIANGQRAFGLPITNPKTIHL